ncbi:MAG: redoxin domain-containing protein [Planctomycetes bacterium]|nr:redoxin domain-containing protein [Planctomycetota bacterium]
MNLRAIAAAFPLFVATAALTAQNSLADLQQQFAGEAMALAGRNPTREQREQLLARHTERLAQFVAGTAQGDDRWNGRMMLAELRLQAGDRKGAGEVLAAIDPDQAPALVLVTAATLAQHLGNKELRTRQIEAGVGKPAPLADRLAIARLLTTVLVEVKRGEKVFTEALAAATDDEQRALVRFHRADSMRDREDLPGNESFDELGKLAQDLPGTYWGSVAKDRLAATDLKVGAKALPLVAKLPGGGEFSLAQQQGKGVVLVFWSSGDRDLPTLLTLLKEQVRQHAGKLAVLGICLDRDAAATAAAVQRLGFEFPTVGDGRGIETDVAMRWFVEGPLVHVVDAAGNMAALRLHAGTNDARNELLAAIAAAVK